MGEESRVATMLNVADLMEFFTVNLWINAGLINSEESGFDLTHCVVWSGNGMVALCLVKVDWAPTLSALWKLVYQLISTTN